MRWAEWILARPSRPARRRGPRLIVQALEDRAVPNHTAAGAADHPVATNPPDTGTTPSQGSGTTGDTHDHTTNPNPVPPADVITGTGDDVVSTTGEGGGLEPPVDAIPFGSGTGEDVIAMSGVAAQPLTIGDKVWKDSNADGKQDAGEPGIANVTLQLYHGVTHVGTATTGPSGGFKFDQSNVFNGTVTDPSDDGLLPNTAYKITVRGDQTALAGLRLTPANAGGDDALDSDATAAGTGATIDVTTAAEGGLATIDLGYATATSIGNLIWNDANNNGTRESGEGGIGGVKVRLLDATGTTEIANTMTADDGSYLFSNLLPGAYVIEVSAANFGPGGALTGYTSSTGNPGKPAPSPYEGTAVPSPNADKTDSDDNGSTANGVVRALPVTVGTAAQGPDNRTVDFGFYKAGGIVGRVYLDANGNGKPEEDETTGIADVRVRAVGLTGSFMAKTDAAGNFAFPNLPAGIYTVTEANQPVGYGSSSPDSTKITVAPGETGAVYFGEINKVDLKLTQTSNKSVAKVGELVSLTYKVKNVGTLTATEVVVKAPVGNGLKFVSSDAGLTGTFDAQASTFAIADLAPGAEAVFKIQARVTRVGVITHRATVTAHETEDNLTNNTASTNVLSPTTPAAPQQPSALTPLQLWWLAAYWFKRY